MKKFIILGLVILLGLSGCVTVKMQKYIKDEAPYKKTYFVSFEKTYEATLKALSDLGWKVSDITSPSTYEANASTNENKKQVLILTEVRQTPLFLTSRYMNLNVYLRALDNGTEVEIRYLGVVPALFKSMTNYKNDAVVKKVFTRIQEILTP